MANVRLIVLMLCACFGVSNVVLAQSKYSENKNSADNRVRDDTVIYDSINENRVPHAGEEERKFRTRIVQQVWERAQRMNMPLKKLSELGQLLQQHDTKVLQLKKMQKDGGDPEGETEALMRRRLTDIMRGFGMISPEDTDKQRHRDTYKRDMGGQEFKDHRINKLWVKAQQDPNFNTLELDQLKEELTHHQEKLDQFEQLSEQLHGQRMRDSNRVDVDKERMDPGERSILEVDLKIRHRELNNDFQQLSSKMIPENHKAEFTDPRVIGLWREAQFANFTEEELESIRTELKHFEAKITKFDSLQVESLHAEKQYHVLKKKGEATDSQKHKELKTEARELGDSVHQFMNDMRGRIQRKRDRVDEL